MGNRVTEITIASVGTIKTAANLATLYVEDIKNIKADAERQKKEAMAAVAELTKELDEARVETRKLT
jgi:F0F1-type ATP synthase membrane subunit b/b'